MNSARKLRGLVGIAGAANATISVPVIDNALIEGAETVVLRLASDPDYALGSPNSATLTIADNEASYQVGAPNNSFWDWTYVSCSKTAGSPRVSGSCSFQIPVNPPAGSYNIRLLSNNGFNLLATSNTITLQ